MGGLPGPGQLRSDHATIGGVEHTILEGKVDAALAADVQIGLVGRYTLAASDVIL